MSSRRFFASRWFFIGTTLVLGGVRCDNSDLIAPVGSSITVTPYPQTIGSPGDSAIITIMVRESDGSPVVDRTHIIVTGTLGTVCVPTTEARYSGQRCTDASASSSVSVETQSGIAAVRFRSGMNPGSVTLTAMSGAVTATSTLTISNQLAPAGATFRFAFDPESVKAGSDSHVTVFLGSGATPVADGTRIVFSATDGSVSPSIGLTTNGFASLILHSKGAGDIFVRAQSGAVIDSAKIVVTP